MAVVYRAFDEHLRIERAVKLLVPAAARIPEARARIETEARAMASLAHPNVVAVFDIRQDGNDIFLVMELIGGGTLQHWVRAFGTMPPRLAVQVMLPVLDAIEVAHDAGIIHRDIKPHNIMLDSRGIPKVADFGIAHVQGPLADASFTRTGAVLGTWAYMAPEQRHSARTVDERSDVYSLGSTLYSLLTGEPPFDLFAADQDRRLLAGIPASLAEPIKRATRYNPADRYQRVSELAEALRAALVDLPAPPEGTPALGSATAALDEPGDFTAGISSGSSSLRTDGPAARLLLTESRRSLPFDDDALDIEPDLSLRWKLVATIGPAFIALAAGGLVMLTGNEEPDLSRQPARVSLASGDVAGLHLVGDDGERYEPGTLAAGHYFIEASFDLDSHPIMVGELDLEPGQRLVLRCSADTESCSAVPL